MATKKKAKPDPAPVAVPAPVPDSGLAEWLVGAIGDVKALRAKAGGSVQRIGLDGILNDLRVLLAAIEAK